MNKETISVINSIVRPEKNLILDTKAKAHNNIKHFSKRSKATVLAAMAASFIFIFGFLLVQFGMENSKDKTVSTSPVQNNFIDVSSPVAAKNNKSIKVDMGDVSMTSPIGTDAEKFAIADSVVLRGKVINSNYVLDGSTVYTKSEVKIIDCYQGNLAKGETVFVRELGGFIPSDVYSNAISVEKYGIGVGTENHTNRKILDVRIEDFKVMETGEEVILFLVPINQSGLDEFKNGCYDLIRMWQGKLLYNEKYDAYVPYVPKYELESEATKSDSQYRNKESDVSSGLVQAKAYSLAEFESFAESVVKK